MTETSGNQLARDEDREATAAPADGRRLVADALATCAGAVVCSPFAMLPGAFALQNLREASPLVGLVVGSVVASLVAAGAILLIHRSPELRIPLVVAAALIAAAAPALGLAAGRGFVAVADRGLTGLASAWSPDVALGSLAKTAVLLALFGVARLGLWILAIRHQERGTLDRAAAYLSPHAPLWIWGTIAVCCIPGGLLVVDGFVFARVRARLHEALRPWVLRQPDEENPPAPG